MNTEEVKERIKVLRQFGIQLKPDEMEYITTLSTDMQLDNFVRHILRKRWGMQEVS